MPKARALVAEALGDLRRCWPQLLAADLAAKAVALLLLVPAYGLLLRAFLAATGATVVSDMAIVSFLLHPIGLGAVLVCSALSLFILLAETVRSS